LWVILVDSMREQVDRLVNRIKEFEAKEIILFGSQVDGKSDEDSDIDLCVITQKSNKRKIDVLRELRRAIAPVLTYPVDLLVYDKDEFYKRASVSSSFEYKIKTEGVKIYEQ
jgi:predicted nucleotidyltransferase